MSGERIKINDEELVALIFGQRRLATKLRGDLRNMEARGMPDGLRHDAGRQLVVTRQLHSRLMDIASSRGIHVSTHREPVL